MNAVLMKKKCCISIFIFIFIASCELPYQPQSVQFTKYRVGLPHKEDTSMRAFLQPISDSVQKRIQVKIATTDVALQKKQPEGALGNVLADALLESASEKLNVRIDAAFLNPGGIRKAILLRGPVTIGDMYEVMPFDNRIVLQEVRGAVLQDFLDFTAARGGWPLAGLTMKIKSNRATNVMIGGKALMKNGVYRIVNSDYIVNGGEHCSILKELPSTVSDYLVRDAFIDYFKTRGEKGEKIFAQSEGRVSYVQ